MKLPDYGDATPGDLACALMRPLIKRLQGRDAAGFVGGETESADTASRQTGSNGPPQPSRDCSHTPGR